MAIPANITVTDKTYCITLPPKISSKGIGVPGYHKNHVLQYGLPQLELQMIVLFVFSQICFFILKPFRLPPFVSQMLGGVIIGQSVLAKNKFVRKLLFPDFNEKESHAREISDAVELFGYSIFLFLVGVKMDMSMLLRVGKKTWVIGVSTIVVPMLIGISIVIIYSGAGRNLSKAQNSQLSFVAVEQSLTGFPVVSCLLSDLKILNTELGRLAISSSLLANITGVAIVLLSYSSRVASITLFRNFALMVVFILFVAFVAKPAMNWVIKHTPEGRQVKDVYLHAIFLCVLLSALFTRYVARTILLGPLILGLAVPDGPPLGSALVNRLESFFTGVLVPFYVTSTVARANFDKITSKTDGITFEPVILVLVFIVKVVGTIIPPLVCKIPFKDSLALALILCCKGIVELGTYRFLHDQKELNDGGFAMLVLVVLVSSTITPLLVRKLFDSSRKFGGYQTRNVMHLKPNMELPMVTIIHRVDNIDSMIGMVSCLNPSRESPIRVNAIHLVKPVGQAMPVLISHQQQRRIIGKSYSDDVILAFTNYARNNMGAVNANMFTAISPAKLMFEDVCHIALDKIASLIILPFHCKWSSAEGKITAEDVNIRNLNIAVLQKAPCSVAILIDRGHLAQLASTKPQFHVGMFYIGGEDDREALALVRRMAWDQGLIVTVIHLCEGDDSGAMRLEEVMDDEMLGDVRGERDGTNVLYKREVVQDGPQTALLVRTMVNHFDMVVVGRRYGMECTQTSGLSDWTEVAELGVLGDLLASPDLHTDASILVVQTQKKEQ